MTVYEAADKYRERLRKSFPDDLKQSEVRTINEMNSAFIQGWMACDSELKEPIAIYQAWAERSGVTSLEKQLRYEVSRLEFVISELHTEREGMSATIRQAAALLMRVGESLIAAKGKA